MAAHMGTVKTDMSELVSAIQKFIEWQEEYADIKLRRGPNDSAGVLMDVLGIPSSDVAVLIGGSDAPIFRRAAQEIASLRQAIGQANNLNRELVTQQAKHSIHCAGYLGRCRPFDETRCDCGAKQ